MDKLYLGIEIGDACCRISYLDPEQNHVQLLKDEYGQICIPSLISLNMDNGVWKCGRDADSMNGRDGIIVLNRPESLFHSRQLLKTEESEFHADDIFLKLLEYLVRTACNAVGTYRITCMTICLDHVTVGESDRIRTICKKLNIETGNVYVVNRQESLAYHLYSQKKDIWNNTCFLFDYSESGLWVYETRVLPGIRPLTVSVNRERLNEAPGLPGNESPEQVNKKDEWFAALAKDMLDGRIVSSLFLCGSGFKEYKWAQQFLKTIRMNRSRKVFQLDEAFCIGAAFCSYHHSTGMENFRYQVLGEGRTDTAVSIVLDHDGNEEQVVLIGAGMSCSEAKACIELSLIEESTLVFYIRKIGTSEKKTIRLKLDDFINDTRDRTRIRLQAACTEGRQLLVRVEDLGFGEIFPCNDRILQKKYDLDTLKEM